MTNSLNFASPLSMSIGAVVRNGQCICTLPSFPLVRYMLGFSMSAAGSIYPGDFIDPSPDEFNFIQLNIRGYLESVGPYNLIYNDDNQPKHPSFTRWFLTPIPVPANTRLLWVPTNLKSTAKVLTNFYVARELPHVVT